MTANILDKAKNLFQKRPELEPFPLLGKKANTQPIAKQSETNQTEEKHGFLDSISDAPKKYLNKLNTIYTKNITAINQVASPIIKLLDEDIICAKVTLESYVDTDKRAKTLDAYTLDEKRSTENSCIYFNQAQNNCIIGYRGTVATNVKDISSDAQIVLDIQGIDPRVKDALNTYDTVKREYPGYSIRVCGHSLGGTLSYIVAKHRNPARCTVFNPGGSFNTFFIQMLEDTYRHIQWAENTYTYKILGDIISTLAFVGHTKVFTIGAKDPLALHAVENFRPKIVSSP